MCDSTTDRNMLVGKHVENIYMLYIDHTSPIIECLITKD